MAQDAATKVFRASALERLSSPEQLDRLIKLSRPYDWIAAVTLMTIVVLAMLWSVLGTVPTRVKGSGIFIATQGRLLDAVASGEGTLVTLLATVGTTVKKGQIVAEVEQQDLRQSLINAQAVVSERESQHDNLTRQLVQNSAAREQTLGARKAMLELRAKDADERAKTLASELRTEEAMFERRLITFQRLSETRQALATARQTVLEARSQASQADSEEIASSDVNQRDLRSSLERLADARRRVSEIEVQIRQREQIRSPADGRVTEWKVAPGTRVSTGLALLGIESGVTGIELMLYLPPDHGKRVSPGMDVRISPSIVRREEFGTMIGTVEDVSDFPSTPQAMQATLQNDKLVAQLSPKGPPFAARVLIKTNPRTFSGFIWTGGNGPNVKLTSGTLADGEVTVAERAPISYVIPWLKKATGLDN